MEAEQHKKTHGPGWQWFAFGVALFGMIGLLASDAGAYPTWDGCEACHGGFRGSLYVSLSDGEVWNTDLHDGHRFGMLSGDCFTCHAADSFFPVHTNTSAGGQGFPPIACIGCHGRVEDRPDPAIPKGDGAGLRQHHSQAGVLLCFQCHADADPAVYTPVGEDVLPPYYALPDADHPDKPTDPCNRAGEEDFAASPAGLDNDGDLSYDSADSDCPAPHARLEHFLFYKARTARSTPKFYRFGPVRLQDAFGSALYDVKKPKALGLPADKNAEGVIDPNTHLEQYGIKPIRGAPKFSKRSDVRILNQCNDLWLELKKPVSLLVPTAAGMTGPVASPSPDGSVVDHFLCYKAGVQSKHAGEKLARFPKGTQVDVADALQVRRYDLEKVTKLCVPANKDEDPGNPSLMLAGPARGQPHTIEPALIRNPDRVLVCYKAKLASRYVPQFGCGCDTTLDPACKGKPIEPAQSKDGSRVRFHTHNQFGAEQLDSIKAMDLCLPSEWFPGLP